MGGDFAGAATFNLPGEKMDETLLGRSLPLDDLGPLPVVEFPQPTR